MALGDYEKTTYVNGQAPGISANNLNKNEDKTEELDTAVKTHLAEEATQDELGHIRLSDIPQPIDYGRYQAEFGWDGAILNNIEISNNTASLDTTVLSEQDAGTEVFGVYGNTGGGQRYDSTFTANMDVINWVEIYPSVKNGSPPVLRISVFDETTSTLLGQVSKSASQITAGQMNRFVFNSPISITRGNVIQVRVDTNGSGDGSNNYNLYRSASNIQSNAFHIYTSNLWSSKSDITDKDLRININYTAKNLSGTATKTIIPSDIKKWGNLKWTQNTPENTSVVCDVLDASNNVLKAGVTSVEDLTDINISTYQSIKTRWTLTRDSVEDESPTVSNPSWTWEGADIIKDSVTGTKYKIIIENGVLGIEEVS